MVGEGEEGHELPDLGSRELGDAYVLSTAQSEGLCLWTYKNGFQMDSPSLQQRLQNHSGDSGFITVEKKQLWD